MEGGIGQDGMVSGMAVLLAYFGTVWAGSTLLWWVLEDDSTLIEVLRKQVVFMAGLARRIW